MWSSLLSRLDSDNASRGQAGADALVRARPPGRVLALIVNSHAGESTSAWRLGKRSIRAH